VALKTVGLLSLMAQAALPVPAAEAEFPVFEQVLADIGDYQSIQENLSTFSAHVSNIREMALDVTPGTLCCSMSWARRPIRRKAARWRGDCGPFPRGRRVHAGLHAPDGAQDLRRIDGGRDQRVDGFDENTFEPTFLLQLGLPGKSAGLEIATRLGMPEDIMRRARWR